MKMLTRLWLALSLLAALAMPAASQTVETLSSTTCPGSGCVTVPTGNRGSASVQLVVSGTATAIVEGSIDGRTYNTLQIAPWSGGSAATSATTTGAWTVNVAGSQVMRVRLSACSSCSVVVLAQTSQAGGGAGGSTTGTIELVDGDNDPITDDMNDAMKVSIVSGAASGTTDTDDASIAAGQATVGLSLSLGQMFNGTAWVRTTGDATNGLDVDVTRVSGTVTVSATNLDVQSGGADLATESTLTNVLTSTNFANAFGTAGTADSQVMSVQGIGSMTPLLVNPGTGTNFGVQAEDAVAGSGFNGIPSLAVRQDSQADLAADGAFIPLTVDGDGGLRVSIVAGAGSGGTALADDADFTPGTTSFTPVGGLYQSSVTAITDGDVAAVGLTAQRTMKVTLFSAAGSELTQDTQGTHATSWGTITSVTGGALMGNASSATPTDVGSDGDAVVLWATRNGALNVADAGGSLTVDGTVTVTDGSGALNVIVDSGTVTTLSQLGGTAVPIEDAGETADGTGIYAMGVRRDTAASSAGTTGDNTMASYDALGRLWTRMGDPCSDHARITTAAISTTTNGNVEVVALNGSDLIYVCSVSVVETAAQSFQLIYGTGTACATGETDLTGPYAFAANGGMVLPNTGVAQFVVPAGNAFCIETNGTGQTSGHVAYVRTATP